MADAWDQVRVLLVEDDALVRVLVEDMLLQIGVTQIQEAESVAQAHGAIDGGAPDLAVLDLFLAGELVYPVAERLKALGARFVFITGFGRKGLDPAWAEHVVLQKPFSRSALEEALRTVRDAGA